MVLCGITVPNGNRRLSQHFGRVYLLICCRNMFRKPVHEGTGPTDAVSSYSVREGLHGHGQAFETIVLGDSRLPYCFANGPAPTQVETGFVPLESCFCCCKIHLNESFCGYQIDCFCCCKKPRNLFRLAFDFQASRPVSINCRRAAFMCLLYAGVIPIETANSPFSYSMGRRVHAFLLRIFAAHSSHRHRSGDSERRQSCIITCVHPFHMLLRVCSMPCCALISAQRPPHRDAG